MRDWLSPERAKTIVTRWVRESAVCDRRYEYERLMGLDDIRVETWLAADVGEMILRLTKFVYRRDLETRVVRVPERWQDALLDSLAPCLPRWLRRRLPRPRIHRVVVQSSHLLVPNKWEHQGPVLELMHVVEEGDEE